MDDQVVMRTYGNMNLPEDTEDHPLVTFALFAYNQEECIHEAVEGAFAQTYSPLEIILSDDCSSDRTFEIMEEMAREYRGQHLVKVRRGEINLGTALHVSVVAKASKGCMIVAAAGDDISEAQRCEAIVKTWKAEGSPNCCIHSSAVFFEEGNDLEKFSPARMPSLGKDECINFALRDTLPFFSPTCAYTRSIFSNYDPLIGGSIIEDGVMALRSLATGTIISINDPLVRIRKSAESAGTGYSIANPQRWNRFILSRKISYFTKLRDLPKSEFDAETKKRLAIVYMDKISRLSRFALPTTQSPSLFQRARFFLKYIILYPSSARLPIKCADAAKISGFSDSSAFRAAHWFFKGRHT